MALDPRLVTTAFELPEPAHHQEPGHGTRHHRSLAEHRRHDRRRDCNRSSAETSRSTPSSASGRETMLFSS